MPAISRFFGFLVLFGLPFCAPAQPDTTLVLPPVEISEPAIRMQSTGSWSRSWSQDALREGSYTCLADWLAREGGLYLKSYGLGSIATTSIRGGSAAHTRVLWNGLPIQSPMLGQLDFSLFPVFFVDDLQLHYGGNSAAWGSGAIGGVIGLQNQFKPDSTLQAGVRTTAGSFGFFDQQLRAAYNNGRWGIDTRFFHRQANNDFPYQIRPDLPEKKQTHAALQQTGLMQSLYWRPGRNQQLALQLWMQTSEREIPPTTVQNQSLAGQTDEFIRTALHWKRVENNAVWQAKIALFRETIDYRDELIRLRAFTGFWTALGEIEGHWAWNARQQLQVGITHNWMTAHADAYEDLPQQNRSAAFAAYRQSMGRWLLQLNLRQEMVDGKFLPLIPGLGLEGRLTGWLTVRAKLSRNYRLPTLNDLYWQPGGNPDLLPEYGWSQEAGLSIQPPNNVRSWSYQITFFNRNIRNWILWSKPEDQPFWASLNIAEVWSRGMEQVFRFTWKGPSWTTRFQAGYDFILSTNEIALSNPRLDKGAQLVYVPRHQGFAGLAFQWKQLGLRYQHIYTGPVNSLNAGILPAFDLGFAGINYKLVRQNWNTQLFFHIHNLWDVNYRLIERQPMPGRHFQTGIHVQFIKKNKRR